MSILARVAAASRPRDNAQPQLKLAIREWLRERHGVPQRAYEVFGSAPANLSTRYLRHIGCRSIDGPAGDALEALGRLVDAGYDWWDVDPYGDPFPALERIAGIATAPRLAVFVCDGGLLRSAKLRTPLPVAVARATGWHPRDMRRMTWCWHHYPQALALVLRRLFEPRYHVEAVRVAPYSRLPTGGAPLVRYGAFIAAQL